PAPIGRDVENGPEFFAAELIEGAQLDELQRKETTGLAEARRHLADVEQLRLRAHAPDVPGEPLPRRRRDHRAYVRGEILRRTDLQETHGADQHLDDAVSRLLLQIQHA